MSESLSRPAAPSADVQALEPEVRRLMIRQMAGKDFSPAEFEAAARPGRWRLFSGIACLVVLPLIPIGIGLIIAHMVAMRAYRRGRGALVGALSRGRLRMAWVVMINEGILTGALADAPALALVCCDEGPEPEDRLMHEVLDTLEVAGIAGPDGDERALAALLADEQYVPFRRRAIPARLTEERRLCACDLAVSRSHLAASITELPWIPCLVEPGLKGGIMVVPHEVMRQAMGPARP